ncbi:MAG TPA: outer membrane protein transport protein, partial [Polyangiaceae bacterium]|nr:outer membrane protein transport protein [Polyangiaceae bacterium]
PGEIAGVPVAFGMAAQLPQGYLSRAETIRESDPYWVFYEARMQLLYTSVNLAVMPVDGWAVGVGTASLATTRGGFQVRGTTVAAEFGRSEYESDLEHQIDATLVSTRYPQVSTSLELDEALSFGLSYREEAKLETVVAASLDTVIDGTVVEIPVRYDVVVRSVKMFIPRQLNLAAAWSPSRLSLELDLTWYDWSSYQSPVSSTTTDFEADPPEGVGIDLPEAPTVAPPDDPRFSDRLVPRVGAEYTVPLGVRLELPLRAGYVYEATPVPPQTGDTSFLDSTRHLLSVGAGMKVKGRGPVLVGGLRVDLAFQWGLCEEREQTKVNGDRLSTGGSFWVASADTSLEF